MNQSIMKCCICNSEHAGEFITINYKKYHLCCIEQLQQENEELKELNKTILKGLQKVTLKRNKWKRRYENEHKIKRELKKQLHEAGLQIQSLIEENMSCPSSCSKIEELKSQKQEWEDLVDKFKNQQKEFIDWLKERIKTLEDKLTKYNELVIQGKETDVEYYLSIIDERELDAYKKVLSKYKEIIGVKDE